MKDAGDKITPIEPSRKLEDAIRDVKNAFADRDDVVVDMREAHRMRLELLATELAPVFAEVPAALDEARRRGWKLAILSNTDRDFIEASMRRIGVPFELAVVASEIGSYKPDRRHWDEFFARTGAEREHHVHVGASLFHDIAPARELGLRSVWINRLGESADSPPTRELPDLEHLPDVLDELIAA